MKKVVLTKSENNQIITYAELIKKGACQSSLKWLAENLPDLDNKNISKETFIIYLKQHQRVSDAEWVEKNLPDLDKEEVYIEDIDECKYYLKVVKSWNSIYLLRSMSNVKLEYSWVKLNVSAKELNIIEENISIKDLIRVSLERDYLILEFNTYIDMIECLYKISEWGNY